MINGPFGNYYPDHITSSSPQIHHLQELIENHFLNQPTPKDLQLVNAHIDHTLHLLHHQRAEPSLQRRLEGCKKLCAAYLSFHYENDHERIGIAKQELLSYIRHL